MESSERKLSRRQLLIWGAGAASVAVLSACSQPAATPAATKAAGAATPAAGAATPAAGAATKAPAAGTPGPKSGDFDWMQQKGKSIVVSAVLAVYYPVLQKLVPEFTKKTGIEVDFQVVPEQQLRQKLPIELNAKSSAIDVYVTSMHVEKILFIKAGWYEPLSKYLEDPKLTPPDYDWKDVGPAGISWVTGADGIVYTVPMGLGLVGNMWRKDLYDAAGLKTALTMDEMIASIKKVHNPPTTYGFIGRGLKNANIPVWGGFLHALGGTYLSPDKKELTCTTPEAVEAARIYADLMKNYAPPGSIGFNWMECQGSYQNGQVATWPDSIQFAAPFEDKTKSKVAGKNDYSPHPGSAKMKPFGATSNDSLAINPFGKNKEASWLFCAWASSKDIQRQLMLEAAMIGTRQSIYSEPEFISKHSMPKEWIEAVAEGLKFSVYQLPELQDVSLFRDTYGVALTKMIEGGDPKTLLEQAQKEFEPTFKKSLS